MQVSDEFVKSLSQVPAPGMPSEVNPLAWLDYTGSLVCFLTLLICFHLPAWVSSEF